MNKISIIKNSLNGLIAKCKINDANFLKLLELCNTYFKNNASINVYKAYDLFYFEKGEPQFAINNSKGLIFLHNISTISKYKRMTKKRFLK